MNLLAIDELAALAAASHRSCISIYTPMERLGVETQQNPIRFKNLLRQVEERLLALECSGQEIAELLQPIYELDTYDFWQHQSDGLAIFRSPDLFRYYCLPMTLPTLAVATDRFHLKPLLQLLSGDGQFYILALSQNQVRLFQGTRYSVSEVELTDLPTSMAEALQLDDPQQNLQFHTGTSPGGGGDRAAIFHGQGAGNDERKANLLRYFRQVNDGLASHLHGSQAPLVLAGVDYLLPIYQQVSTYTHILPVGVTGNPEILKPEELHNQAWQIVQPYFELDKESTVERFEALQGTGKTAHTIEQVVSAAYFQRVETLFVTVGEQVWGSFDPETNAVQIHDRPAAGDEDLLNLAALHTLLNAGTIYAVEPGQVPENRQIAAIFRY